MSADNWTQCPRCLKRDKFEADRRSRAAAESYGRVPAAEYERLCEAARQPPREEALLREDWEAGMDGTGLLQIFYHASCQRCGFKHDFKHSEQVVKS